MMTLNSTQKSLRKRLLQFLFEANTSHIGSSLSMIDLIEAVYAVKSREDRCVLSNGHSAMALYTVLEHHSILPKDRARDLGVHPDRDPSVGIDVSTGSLGQGLPIAVGMAIANPQQRVFCLISDGECAEGSIWEALRIIQTKKLSNLRILLSANGWGAYDPINTAELQQRLKGFGFAIKKIDGHNLRALKSALKKTPKQATILFAHTNSEQFPFLRGQDAHYCVMSESDYRSALKELS